MDAGCTWSHDLGIGLWSIGTLAGGQPGFKSPQLSRMPFFHHFTLVYRKMDGLSDPNVGQARPESWTAAGSLSMDAFQLLTSISGHIAALQGQVPTTTHCWLLWGGMAYIGDRTLYLGCCDVAPCRITFKFNSSSPRLLRHVNVSSWHIWTCPTAHTRKCSL